MLSAAGPGANASTPAQRARKELGVSKILEHTGWEHLLLVLAFAAWWLMGAGWLLQRSLRRKAGVKRQALAPCVLAIFLALAAAGVIGLLAYTLVSKVGESAEDQLGYRLPGAVVAAVLAIPTAILVLYAAFQLPLGRLLRVCWPALGSVILAGAVLGGAFLITAKARRDVRLASDRSVTHLMKIYEAVQAYEDAFDKQPPPNLPVLTEELTIKGKPDTLLQKGWLPCPFLGEAAVGYFYCPPASTNLSPEKAAKTLLACEWTHSHSARYRAMLFANGDARANLDQEFQAMLNLPENAEFAKLFRAADANRR
jgi:hypothetical protein